MEEKTIHYMYKEYNLYNSYMENIDDFKKFMNKINDNYIQGELVIIPYFDGKIKNDGGISGCIVGNGKHFTCHTFCYHGNVYIDNFNINTVNYKELSRSIKAIYNTNDFNEIIVNESNKTFVENKNKFGKHIIVKTKGDISIELSKTIIEELLVKTNMTPIHDLIVNQYDLGYDLIQLIAESHISCHKFNDLIYFDIFSCKDYSTNDVEELFKDYEYEFFEVIRGIKNN